MPKLIKSRTITSKNMSITTFFIFLIIIIKSSIHIQFFLFNLSSFTNTHQSTYSSNF